MNPDDDGEKSGLGPEAATAGKGLKRPLVPLVLALMLGLAAADWGLDIPRGWLVAGLAALLLFLVLSQFSQLFRESRPNKPDKSDELPQK